MIGPRGLDGVSLRAVRRRLFDLTFLPLAPEKSNVNLNAFSPASVFVCSHETFPAPATRNKGATM